MKRRIIIAFFALCAAAMAKAQVENVRYWDLQDIGWWVTSNDTSLITDSENTQGQGFECDGISVRYQMDHSIFWNAFPMEIKNLTDSTVTVKWSKSQIDGKRVVTGEEMDIRKEKETEDDDYIYPCEEIIRYVSSSSIVRSPSSRPLNPYTYKKDFEKEKHPQYGQATVTLCMERGGVEKTYRFTLHCVYNGKRK